MRQMNLNILSEHALSFADAICFTSNGIIKNNGELVMGAGNALSFKKKWPKLPLIAGKKVKDGGNKVHSLYVDPETEVTILSFPTKHHWKHPSDISLIVQSAIQLQMIAECCNWQNVLLPRPGVGMGGLKWDEVLEVIAPILSDRIIVVSNQG